MSQASSSNSNDLALWLKAQAAHFSGRSRSIWLLGVFRFWVAACAYFVLAQVLASAVTASLRPPRNDLLLLAVLFCVQLLLQWFTEHQKAMLAGDVLEHYQQRLARHLKQHSLAALRDYPHAVWQSAFMKRIPALQAFFCDYLPQVRLAAIIPLLVVAFVVPFSWLAAVLLAIAAPLIPLFMWLVGKGATAEQQKNFVALERLGSLFLDRLRARQLLHVHQAVRQQQSVFALASRSVKTRTMAVLRMAFLSSSVLDFFATLGVALVAVFVGFSLLDEIRFGSWQSGLSLSEGLFILLLTPLFFSELKLLGSYYHLRAEAIAAADIIMNVLTTAQESPSLSALPVASSSPKNIDMEILDAAGNRLVYAKQLIIRQNDKILIHGDSGSGKTTLLEVLQGMRPGQSNCQQVLPRGQVAWLGQNPGLSPESVRKNITLGCQAEECVLLQLLDDVDLLPWLKQLPQGLDTPLGDYPPLSGGQKQRLAIARLLFFSKPFVVLDEPTAHLSETQSEQITRLLQDRFKNQTVVWVSHDLGMSDFFTQYWKIDGICGVLNPVGEVPLCA